MNFFKRILILTSALVFAFKCNNPVYKSNVMVKEKINGLSVAAGPNLFDSLDAQHWKSLNAQWICFMPYGFLDEKSGAVYYNNPKQWKGETINGIYASVQLAKQHDFKIFIKPQLWCNHGKYTGNIKLSGKAWGNFLEHYTQYLLLYLRAADSLHCDLFSMGTELNHLIADHEKDWISLTEKLSTYSTPLTYCENWDAYDKISFWNKLDYIGVNAYFPVSEEKDCSFENTKESWNNTLMNLEHISALHQKPVLFTEYGYRSIDFCGKEPWKYDHEAKVNEQAQANCLNSLFLQCWDKKWFAGGFLWKEYGHLHP